MNKKIALLPLDSRPVNIKYPHYISKICGFDLNLPPIKSLGNLESAGIFSRISKWLQDASSNIDLIVLSIDMLAFGGLVHSRDRDISVNEAASRLELLVKIKKDYPKIRIFAFSEIMRLSVTAKDEKSAELWMNIYEFSKAVDRLEKLGEKSDSKKLDKLRKKIPRDILDNYLKTRQRNHEINKTAVNYVAEGIIDYLVLGVEDSGEYGLHKKEKKAMQDIIDAGELNEKIKIINGADEIASMLVAKAKLDENNQKLKILIRYLDDKSKDIISLYEDKSVKDVMSDHLNVLGATECFIEEKSDLKIFVNTPKSMQIDAFLSEPKDIKGISQDAFYDINKTKVRDKPYVVIDIKYCNAADPGFVLDLIKKFDYFKIFSYSGFNTSANAIGLSIAQACSFMSSDKDEQNILYQKECLLYFLINDYLYQAAVRPELIGYLKTKKKSLFDTVTRLNEASYLLKEKMIEKKRELIDPYLGLKELKLENIKFPWNRIFEIDFDIKFSV